MTERNEIELFRSDDIGVCGYDPSYFLNDIYDKGFIPGTRDGAFGFPYQFRLSFYPPTLDGLRFASLRAQYYIAERLSIDVKEVNLKGVMIIFSMAAMKNRLDSGLVTIEDHPERNIEKGKMFLTDQGTFPLSIIDRMICLDEDTFAMVKHISDIPIEKHFLS